MAASNNLRRNILIGLGLALITLAVYWPVRGFEFTNFDDNLYVTENAHLPSGFTSENLSWAFTSGYASNWHPLTWLSHMEDVQLYGLNPAGHHLTNLWFHVANTLLLFGLLVQWTGKAWRSALVAALFAWHPMHVESVAWVAERKDVLSTFFGLLSLWAYGRYVNVFKVQSLRVKVGELKSKVQSPSSKVYYGLALLFFALGLMAKPMLVSLPLILLLLDYWPFGRIYDLRFTIYKSKAEATVWRPGRWLVWLVGEKIPFFLLTALSCLVTFWVQKKGGAVVATHLPLGERVANALVAYVRYVDKLLWPQDLAVLYPYNHALPLWEVLGAALVMALASIVALWGARKRPYVAVGWFWFLITLVPVIGLVQVGEQAMADRYTYLPATGLFVLAVWGAAEMFGRHAWSQWALGLAATCLLSTCLFATSQQLRYWQNSVTLFTHAIQVTDENATPHNNLGGALTAQGKYDEAIEQFDLALKLRPKWEMAQNNLGIALLDQGKLQDAITSFQAAITIKPDYGEAHINLGIALARQGKLDEAIVQYRKALEISPSAEAHNRLGGALERQGKTEAAAQHYATALVINPGFAEAQVNLASIFIAQGKFGPAKEHLLAAVKSNPDLAAAHNNLGNSLAGLGDLDQAAAEYLRTLKLQPDNPQAHLNLANLMARHGQLNEAILHYSAVLKQQPDLAQAHINLAYILNQQGKVDKAIDHYRAALRSDPHAAVALENLAWILATQPDPKLRDGAEALRLSTLAAQSAAPTDATAWDIQAAACAEAGKFAEAVSAAKKAIDLANASQNKGLVAQIQSRLKHYEAGQAFHESAIPQE